MISRLFETSIINRQKYTKGFTILPCTSAYHHRDAAREKNHLTQWIWLPRSNNLPSDAMDVTSQHVGQLRGSLEDFLCIASQITGFFRAFITKI
jgi:hypothetical protein